MSQPVSPQGSPTAQAGSFGATAMEDLAKMLANAAEAAAKAATVATEATQTGSRDGKKDLYKLIQKPAIFAHSDRDKKCCSRGWYWSLSSTWQWWTLRFCKTPKI